MKKIFGLLAVAATMLVTSQAEAVRVTAISAGSGLGTAYTLNSATVTTGTENNDTLLGAAGPAGAANVINIDVNVLQKFVPFDFDLSVIEDGTGSGGTLPTSFADANSTRYTVNFTLTHAVVGSPGNAINGFDVVAGGSVSPLFNGISTPFASPFTINAAPLPGGVIRFGGLNGGGTGQLTPGQSATTSFDFLVTSIGAGGPTNQTLTFTANPEPGTMMLGGLALIPAGIYVRRRRNQMTCEDAA